MQVRRMECKGLLRGASGISAWKEEEAAAGREKLLPRKLGPGMVLQWSHIGLSVEPLYPLGDQPLETRHPWKDM